MSLAVPTLGALPRRRHPHRRPRRCRCPSPPDRGARCRRWPRSMRRGRSCRWAFPTPPWSARSPPSSCGPATAPSRSTRQAPIPPTWTASPPSSPGPSTAHLPTAPAVRHVVRRPHRHAVAVRHRHGDVAGAGRAAARVPHRARRRRRAALVAALAPGVPGRRSPSGVGRGAPGRPRPGCSGPSPRSSPGWGRAPSTATCHRRT